MEDGTRRQFLKVAGGATLGLAAASSLGVLLSACSTKGSDITLGPVTTPTVAATPAVLEIPALPWQYVKLDPVAAAERGYTNYYNGGCMFGTFEGILGELRDQIGFPYTTFPSAMTKYGGGGVAGWGTLCGTLNGAGALIYLVAEAKTAGPIINELYGWYGSQALPDYSPQTPKFTGIKQSVSESPLCHVSVTRWCEESGFKALSPERSERCGWLTASVAKYTVELLNKNADSLFAITHAVPAEVKACLSCHGKGGVIENVHASAANTCTGCHIDLGRLHPKLQ